MIINVKVVKVRQHQRFGKSGTVVKCSPHNYEVAGSMLRHNLINFVWTKPHDSVVIGHWNYNKLMTLSEE